VLNGASLQTGSVAPGEIVTLFGAGLLPAGGAPVGVGVTFNGVAAPLLYEGPNQINAIVPFAVAGQTSARIAVTYVGQEIGSVTTVVAAVAPAVFTVNASGKGQGLILNQDLTPNSASQPAARGSTVTLYATGAGSMNPPLQDGQIVPAGTPSVPASPITVRFDGAIYAAVTYAGPAPGLIAGILQVNFVVPTNLSPGPAVPFFTVAGSTQAPFVTMAVQ
jgi:uncharacterized protein (TIGR03437 family)